MGYQVKQSSTAYPLVFLMVDSTDHVTAKTGLSPTVTLSKAGGSFASPSGSVTEIGSGWYKVAGNATDAGTLGPLILHATGTAADPVDILYEVVAFDPQDSVRLGLTALPNAAAEASGGLVTRGTGTGQITVSSGAVTVGTNSDKTGYSLSQSFPSNFASLGINASGHISRVTLADTITTYTGNTVQTGDSYARIGANGASLSAIPWNASWDAEVQSECADALNAYDPPTKTEMDAAFTEIKGATWSSTDTLEAIRDRGDAAWVTSTFSITASAIASQVRTELTTELGRIDAAISTRATITAMGIGSPGGVAGQTSLTGAITAIGVVDGIVDNIILDTDELQQLLTTAMTESYATDGSPPTFTQFMYMLWSSISQFDISSTTITTRKLDGTTSAMTFTMNDATSPTSRTRAT